MSSRRAPEDRIAPSTTDAIPRHVPIATLETLFDRTPDTVFFVKDRDGRYVAVNQTLVERCGARSKGDLVGRTAEDVFGPFGRDFREQDRQVLERGVEVRDRLELHLYRGRHPGWCMTHKVPLHDAPDAGADGIVGLIGLSRDLQPPDERVDSIFGRLA
ncbi:MAG: PAS domain-containing protein, partial [Acidobacteriota bacterium]